MCLRQIVAVSYVSRLLNSICLIILYIQCQYVVLQCFIVSQFSPVVSTVTKTDSRTWRPRMEVGEGETFADNGLVMALKYIQAFMSADSEADTG